MKIIIDRFEGSYALVELEDKQVVEMAKVLLPHEASEGDVIEIRIDRETTDKRRNDIKKLMDSLWDDQN